MCRRSLGKPYNDAESELIMFLIEKGSEEPRPRTEKESWISKDPPLFVTDVLLTDLLRAFNA